MAATKRREPAAPKPGFLATVDPKPVRVPPSAADWVHEIKHDGYRGQAHLQDGRATMFTRAGNDWTQQFAPLPEAVAKLKARDAILDGEVVAVGADGVSDFHALRRLLGVSSPQLRYEVFDLLWLDGQDLRPLPLAERKARLKRLLADAPVPIVYVDHVEGDGRAVLRSACELGLEGIVSKRLDSTYRATESSRYWLKAKCAISETFIVIGFTEDKTTRRIKGLLLGRAGEGGTLTYAGAVENGIGSAVDELERRLRPLTIAKSVVPVPTDARRARWTRPGVLVEVTYPNKTATGRIRHPSFKGFRDDLLP
jgi:bifunctional non-homologous end joining protein LigD